MKLMKQLLAMATIAFATAAQAAPAVEAPDVLVKRISQDVIDTAKADKAIQAGDIKRVTDTCSDYYQTCQESWHPSAAGHQVLGQCLTGAWNGASTRLTCTRQPDGSIGVG